MAGIRTTDQLQLERSVLGNMLLNRRRAERARRDLTNSYFTFTDIRHQVIYRVIVQLVRTDQPADPVTVAAALAPNLLGKAGGANYLHDLISGADPDKFKKQLKKLARAGLARLREG